MNRVTANLILCFVFACFVILLLLEYMYSDVFILRMLLFITEAALIGGIADWFAVTALFRKPLGFPFHTAIIPRNRAKLIHSISTMVQRDLLSIGSIMNLTSKISTVNLLVRWIDSKKNHDFFYRLVCQLVHRTARQLDPREMARTLERLVKQHAEKLQLNRQLAIWIRWALEKGKHDQWFTYLLHEIAAAVRKESTKQYIHDLIHEALNEKKRSSNTWVRGFLKLGEWTNSINSSEASETVYAELLDFVESLKDQQHPMRVYLQEALMEWIDQLEHQPPWIEGIEEWKKSILTQIQLQELFEHAIQSVLEYISKSASETGESGSSPIVLWLTGQLEQYWERFKQDQQKLNWLEAYIQEALSSIIHKEHYLVGQLVVETLQAFTDKALNQFIEDKVGNDLQWIRINGSLVGSFVGLLLFLFVEGFYGPVVAPVIRSWFS